MSSKMKQNKNAIEHKSTTEQPGRVRPSIAKKLSSRMLTRLLGIFLSLDIILCLFTSLALIYHSEQRVEMASAILLEYGMPSGSTAGWLELSGVDVTVVLDQPAGVNIPLPFSYVLPKSTRDGLRSVLLPEDLGASFSRRLDGLQYVVYMEQGGTAYRISVALGPIVQVLKYVLAALLIYELFAIFSRAGKDRRMVRRMLDPIMELTRATQSLNAVTQQLDPKKMAALTGKLEGINASRLDTRIQIDDTQEELKNLAGAINGMLDRINESYGAQVRFVSDASHELRTPISVIQGYANLLDRWGKNDEKTLQESISAIKDEAANMKDLVEQLLFLARGDNNTIMLQIETFDLAELVREVAGETKMIDASHEFEVRAAAAMVSADRALIKQALRILVDNAVKYTDVGGMITLTTDSDGGAVKLSVRDNGIGISPEIVPRIFDRFYRAEESRNRATGGAGLGLSIAQWIASRHGGALEVLSREGIGTRISLVLPAAKTSALPTPISPTD